MVNAGNKSVAIASGITMSKYERIKFYRSCIKHNNEIITTFCQHFYERGTSNTDRRYYRSRIAHFQSQNENNKKQILRLLVSGNG